MKLIDLFAGIGGLSLSATWAGFEPAAFVETNPFCQRTLGENFPGVPVLGDITTIGADQIYAATQLQAGAIKAICGGPPCQPYSQAGKKGGNADHRALFPHFLKLVAEILPDWVVVENVVGFIELALDDLLDGLESLGYAAWTWVVPACAVGAYHYRPRMFMVAHSPGKGLEGRTYKLRPGEYLRRLDSALPRHDWRAAPRLLRTDNGFSGELDLCVPREWRERIQALGNSVVPFQSYPFFRAIAEIEAAQAGRKLLQKAS
jgi:DNA (cytosine-5)-methyltransferase 1